jgi:hypothetical protein
MYHHVCSGIESQKLLKMADQKNKSDRDGKDERG